VYLAGAAAPAANLALLDDMLACRHDLARLLGFPSYAAFKAADSTLAGR
jgi:Zn-dependent oligopeptidase